MAHRGGYGYGNLVLTALVLNAKLRVFSVIQMNWNMEVLILEVNFRLANPLSSLKLES